MFLDSELGKLVLPQYVRTYVCMYVQADRTAAKYCPLKYDVVVFTYVSKWCKPCNGAMFESLRDKWSLKPTVTQCVYVCPS